MRTAVVVAVISLAIVRVAAQKPESPAPAGDWRAHESAYYTVFTRDGSDADLVFARQWLDAAERLMTTKYRVTPARYHLSVYLLPAPERDINASQSGQNQCCTTRGDGIHTGTIYFLGPGAPLWRLTPLKSSLGLPKEGLDYHAKVLMSEYIPIGHYAVQDARPAGGWRYYTAPEWFVQGLQEYDGIYHTTEANHRDTSSRLLAWARGHRNVFECCDRGLIISDAYNGGATFMAFLADRFGEDVHRRILASGAASFDEALHNETGSAPVTKTFEEFQAWLAGSR